MLITDDIRIDPAYADALRACGLDRVEAILARTDGRVAAWSRTTDTLYVPHPAGRPGFYLKRYFYPRWKNRVRGALRGTFFGRHRGLAEFHALNGMRAMGIPTVRPVATGARRCGHFVTACFVITEEVPESVNLTSFARDVAAGRRALTPRQRRALIDRLAAEVAELHAVGREHGQLFWRNILVRHGPHGDPEFFFLDAQPRPLRRLSRGGRWWLRELAALQVSAAPFVTRGEQVRFLRRYHGAARLDPELKASARQIVATAEAWRRHEAQRIKMNDLFDEWNRQLAAEG